VRHRSTKTLSIQSVCLCVLLPKKLGRRGRPIRSSFYVGENFSRYRAGAGGATASSRGTIREQLPHTRNSFDEEVEQSAATEEEIRQQQLGVHESFLMATGSADHHVYLYDVGDSVVQSRSGAPSVAPLLQQLHGHTDRVYAVHFHPVHALLASCSADFTIKLWAPRGRA